MGREPRIFLSYSGADTEAARELKRRLLASPHAQAAGLKVWFDKDDLKPGTPFFDSDRRGFELNNTPPDFRVACLTHYYRPDGAPHEQQPWLASVWRKLAS